MDGAREKPSKPKARQSIAHVYQRDNITTDVSALRQKNDAKNGSKRSRGKSLGPGGLEALTETNANSIKLPPIFQPKSILKPSVPLTPPKNIPSFDELRKRNTGKAKSPTKQAAEELLIDFSTPGPSREGMANVPMTDADDLVDPFSPLKVKSPRTSGATNDALSGTIAQDNEEETERRRKQKQTILDQRAARRKSMANRRVSFAPEATLHTWSVMEMAEDSTTSSASNSTRRQSSLTAAQAAAPIVQSPQRGSDPVEPPSTPPEQEAEAVVQDSPKHQRDLHQRKNRRTSEISTTSEDENFSSPGDRCESSPVRVEESIDSDSDTDGDTAMSLDDATANTLRSNGSTSTQSSLDERLRQAASQAGTRGIQYDENGSDEGGEDEEDDEPMDIADGTVTHAFRQYARKTHQVGSNPSALATEEQENINVFEPTSAQDDDQDVTGGMTMDMTQAMGGIIAKKPVNRRKATGGKRQSIAARRQSSGEDTSYGDESMDFTAVKGGILSSRANEEDNSAEPSEDEVTMEFTNVFGGLQKAGTRRESNPSFANDDTETMDMTMAAGGILEPIEEQTEPQTDTEGEQTQAMEFTKLAGRIVSSQSQAQSPSTPVRERLSGRGETGELSLNTAPQLGTVASETGSPSLRPRLSGRRTAPNSRSTTPRSAPSQRSPVKRDVNRAQTTTPTKQTNVARLGATTPEQPKQPQNDQQKLSSVKKPTSVGKTRQSPLSSRKQSNILFSHDVMTGTQTPKVVLQAPKARQHLRRRSSGIGMDQEGLGSPRVSELLARRDSIGNAAPVFKLDSAQKRNIHFENPREMEQEVDAERREEHRRESGRFIMEQEADGRHEENNTLQLKELIESMTPKKEHGTRNKGRKSLAVGSARGLLGKRPAELDDDDNEDDGPGTPKRLKAVSREASPVKKVHLPPPPSKEETTGRLTRAEQRLLATLSKGNHTPTVSQSPPKNPSSPSVIGRFRDVPDGADGQKPESFEVKLDNVVGAIDVATAHPEKVNNNDEEKISLQQFLNLTNIHFIELSTTKRRHTLAPSTMTPSADGEDETSQSCFVAATTTLPLLELYQHATRELKSYISTGRKIIRTIEAETLAEQPVLFKEYLDARPDLKLVMDNQFRNGKINARLQSKEGWYTWRGQLVDGLRTGLEGIKQDMMKDISILSSQEQHLLQVIPRLVERKTSLKQEAATSIRRCEELDTIDHATLAAKRDELKLADQGYQQKLALLETLRQQARDKDDALSQADELKTEMQDQITAANRVRDEHRRWPPSEVLASKTRVEQIEAESGWSLLTAEIDDNEDSNSFGAAVTMLYKKSLKLFFYPSMFTAADEAPRRRSVRKSRSVSGPNAPISLSYSLENDTGEVQAEPTTEQRFFIQLIRSQLHAIAMMPKGIISSQMVLGTVASGWDLALKISQEIKQLNTAGVTRVSIQGDQKLAAQLMLMRSGRSRIDISFALTVEMLNNGEMMASVSVNASPMYGPITSKLDAARIRKIQNALSKEVESNALGQNSWLGAVRGFEEWMELQLQSKQEQVVKAKPKPQEQVPQQQSQRQRNESPARKATPPPAGSQIPRSPLQSSVPSTTPTKVKRSPLAPKTANKIQKKALPVPTQRKPVQLDQAVFEPRGSMRDRTADREKEKENLVPMEMGLERGIVKPPAITPEMQEAMMHTPVKRRIGALRRSPI